MGIKTPCVCLYVQNHTVLAMQVHVPRAWCQRKVKVAKQFSIRGRGRAHLPSPGLSACLVLVLVLVFVLVPQGLISSLAARSNSDFPPCQSYVGTPTGDLFRAICQQFSFCIPSSGHFKTVT